MKIVTPASYTKIFTVTTGTSSVVSAHRGLLLVVGSTNGSVTFTMQDGSTQAITGIPANTVLILPLIIKFLNTATNVTVYGLL